MASRGGGRRGKCRRRLAGEPRQIVLHRLEFRDLLLEGDALVGIAHGNFQIDSSAPAICRERATPPISINLVWSNPCGAGLIVTGCTLSSVTISELSPPRLSPVLDPALAGIDQRNESCPSHRCEHREVALRLSQRHAAALPDRLPSALTVIRSFGLAGTTVISPSGEAILACASSQPASMVSANGTATAKRPAALNTLKPSAREAPEPPQSSSTHDSGRPASLSACQSGAFHAPLLSRLMVWASARSAKIFSAVSHVLTLRHSVPEMIGTGRRVVPRLGSSFLALYGQKP